MQVNYINAHATSTLVGDVAELKAVKKVFTDTSSLKMNATKSMIGHCLGAAGGMEAVATIKAITTGWLHPTINHVRTDLSCLLARRCSTCALEHQVTWHGWPKSNANTCSQIAILAAVSSNCGARRCADRLLCGAD